MARPRSIGLQYFPLDCHLDEKIKILESVHGNDGFAWIVKTWQKAYQTNDGIIDLAGAFGVFHAENCRITTGKQLEIITTCLEIGLLIRIDGEKYTSNGIQKRLNSVNKLRGIDRNRKENEFSAGKPLENGGKGKGKGKGKENNTTKTWRDDFTIYESESLEAIQKIMADETWIAERQQYHPRLNIMLSLKKAYNDFWGSEAGWAHKKRSKIKTIDWYATMANALTMKGNQVWQEYQK